MVPAACSAITASASWLMPGVGMWLPMRYTPSRPSVKSTRLRRSVIAHRFLIGFSIVFVQAPSAGTLLLGSRPLGHQHVRRAAGGQNLLRRLAAELVRLHRQLLRDIAARQHLDRLADAVDEPALTQELRRHHRALVEALGQRVEIHHCVLRAEAVVEAALRHAAVQRHLAAFESALELEARSGLRALVTAPRLDAVAGSLAAADPLLRKLRPLGRFQVAQIHGCLTRSLLPGAAPCGSSLAS